jgi:hypothetical protein
MACLLQMLADDLGRTRDRSAIEFIDDGGAKTLVLEADGVDFLLMQFADAQDDLVVYCVFGQVPAAEEAAVMRRILEVNLGLVRQRRAGFGLDVYTNELTYAFVVPSTVAATPLQATMTAIARQAHEWRKNHYLATRPAATGGAADLLAQFA